MVPLLTGVLKLSQHRAHGTSLAVVFFVGISGTATYWIDEGSLEWELVAALCLGSLVGAFMGAAWMRRVPALGLRSLFAFMLLLVSIRLVFFAHLAPLDHVEGTQRWIEAPIIGLVGGVLAGMLGIGGGAVFVPAMVLLLGEEQHAAQGVSLAVIVFTAATGSVSHLRNDNVDLGVARWIIPFAVPASVLGAWLANRLDGETLQRVFGATVLLVSLQMLRGSWLTWRAQRRLVRLEEAASNTPDQRLTTGD
jgi:uncharacterized membrane protein YfcA